MKVYEYNRVSTSSQEVAQQHNSVTEYINSKGWTIAKSVSDEGVSGGVSYKERNLYNLIQRMERGDVLIVSEISRLGRSMSDLNKLVNDELKPRGLRLIVVKMGLDLDCSNLKAIDEMILFAFGFSAQIEKEMIQERTQSALDVRKQRLTNDGSFVSKKGNVCTSLGRPKGCKASQNAIEASKEANRQKAKANPNNIAFYRLLKAEEEEKGMIQSTEDISRFVQKLNALHYKTAKGMKFDIPRCRSMIAKIRKMFAA